MMDVYFEMLNKLGLPVTPQAIPTTQQPNVLECCSEIELDSKNGNYVCSGCGLVKDCYYYSTEEERAYPQIGKVLGASSSYVFEKKRFYIPLTHFQEHLRRYLGARFTLIPERLIEDLKQMNIDPLAPEAYKLIRKGLKTLKFKLYPVEYKKTYPGTFYTKTQRKLIKSTSLYKEIFTIIYILGGKRPDFTEVEEIKQLYKDFCFYYLKKKKDVFKRKNMPSNYMILDLLLKRLGHKPYYQLPYLKNESLKNDIINIFQIISSDKEDDTFGGIKEIS